MVNGRVAIPYLARANNWLCSDGQNDIEQDIHSQICICRVVRDIQVDPVEDDSEICLDYGPEDTTGNPRPASFT